MEKFIFNHNKHVCLCCKNVNKRCIGGGRLALCGAGVLCLLIKHTVLFSLYTDLPKFLIFNCNCENYGTKIS